LIKYNLIKIIQFKNKFIKKLIY